jgi:hypothetical protein
MFSYLAESLSSGITAISNTITDLKGEVVAEEVNAQLDNASTVVFCMYSPAASGPFATIFLGLVLLYLCIPNYCTLIVRLAFLSEVGEALKETWEEEKEYILQQSLMEQNCTRILFLLGSRREEEEGGRGLTRK